MNAAERALGGGPGTVTTPDRAMLQEYTKCMQANGVPNYAVPLGGAGLLQQGAGGDSDSNSAAYENATDVCFKQTHVHVPGGIGPPGSVEANGLGWVAGA